MTHKTLGKPIPQKSPERRRSDKTDSEGPEDEEKSKEFEQELQDNQLIDPDQFGAKGEGWHGSG